VFNPQASALVEPYRDALSYYNTIGIVVALLIAFLAGAYAFLRLKPDFAARSKVERMVMAILLGASLVAILTTIGILASLVFETVRFFGMVSPLDFLFGTHWGPDPMSNPNNPDGNRYGAVPLFWGTLVIGAAVTLSALTLPVAVLAEITTQALLIVFIIVNAALIGLKRQVPEGPFVVPMAVPVLGIVTCVATFMASLIGGAS